MSKVKKEPQEINDGKFIDDINLEEYNNDIETAMKEMDEGKYELHEDVVKRLFKKLLPSKK
jgi:hypothetical protein